MAAMVGSAHSECRSTPSSARPNQHHRPELPWPPICPKQGTAPSSGAWPTPRSGSINGPLTSDHEQGSNILGSSPYPTAGDPHSDLTAASAVARSDANPAKTRDGFSDLNVHGSPQQPHPILFTT
ncbi:hypothetical protein ACLOJK_004578, partial [Asimina triloba]